MSPPIPRLLHHAESAVPSLDMIVGAIKICVVEEDNHFLEFFVHQAPKGARELRELCVVGIVEETSMAIPCCLFGDASLKQAMHVIDKFFESFKTAIDLNHAGPIRFILLGEAIPPLDD